MKLDMGLGANRTLRLLLATAAVAWGCSAVVAPSFLAAEENEAEKTESEAPSEKPSEPSEDDADEKASSAEAEEEPRPTKQEVAAEDESEQGSSGEEAEPKQTSTEEPEKQKQEEPKKEPEQDPQQSDKQDRPPKKKRVIGATAKILEKESGLVFNARVDTGAKSCSLHVEEMVIENEEEGFQNNINKVVKFKVRNGSDKTRLIERRIKKYVLIKTSGHVERRYKVPLTLSWNGGAVEKKVLVTLNNREGMNYPLLLGRNFLTGDFLVDVDVDSTD